MQIAKLYYIEQKTQQEIADMLFLSRSNVSRLLKICIEKQIVEFYINETTASGEDIASKLKEKFGLEKILIAPMQKDEESTQRALGQMVANYMRKTVTSGMKLGVSTGSVLHYTANSLTNIPNIYVDVVQLVGSLHTKYDEFDGAEIAKEIATAFNGDAYIARVPYKVNSSDLKNMLVNEKNIKIHFAKQIDMAFIAVESIKNSVDYLKKAGAIADEELHLLEREGAVCDVCGIHFNKYGSCCARQLSDKVIGIGYDRLKNIPKVMGISNSTKNADAMNACLKSGILNAIAISETEAYALLDY